MIFKPDIHDDRTIGRLGNKLFVIATMVAYGRKHRQPFAVGPWKYQDLFPRIPVWNPDIQDLPCFREKDAFTYEPIPATENDSLFTIHGYFQSWKYMEEYREEILFTLTPSEAICQEASQIFAQWKQPGKTICSLHIRRGDYLNEEIRRVHGIRPLSYYKTAMQLTKADHFVVFSDDIAWCKETFQNNPRVLFSENHHEVLDMLLMSMCDANIIANSSFSWMGAWLGKPGRTVIAPRQWMANREINLQDLIPPQWVLLDDEVKTGLSTQPLVSIIIPCYKQAHLLPDALESAIGQDYENVEIVVINDGSPDNTSEVVRRYIANTPSRKIQLIEKENGGLSSARNLGLHHSKGEWILPLDSDDMLAPNAVSLFLSKALSSGTDIVFCDRQDFGTSNARVNPGVFELSRIIFNNQLSYCSIYRKNIWEVVGGYDERMRAYEDWNFWIGAAKKGFRGVYLPAPLFLYRTTEQSMYTEAIKHHQQLFCQMVVNHQELYPEELVTKAKQYISLVGIYGEKHHGQTT